MSSASDVLLTVDDLTVRYGAGATAVDGLSIRLARHSIGAVIGLNGAGKTSLLKAISGTIKPASGSIHFDEKRIDGCSPAAILRSGVAHAPEGRRVFPEMTVEENVQIGAHVVRDRRIARERTAYVAEVFPRLRERWHQLAGTLSGGEQQMLAVARALMSGPRLLLLDEPTLGLSPALAKTVAQVVQTIRSTGTTVLVVEQNTEVALAVADFVWVMEAGAVNVSGAADEIRADHKIRDLFFGGTQDEISPAGRVVT